MEYDKEAIGKRIKDIRRKTGDNMREFGERIALKLDLSKENAPSDSIVSRWEKGKSIPNPERLKAIADIGNTSVQELLYGNQDEVLKHYIIEMVQNNEYGLLSIYINYLILVDVEFSDFYNGDTSHYNEIVAETPAQRKSAIEKIALDSFLKLINDVSINQIKQRTGIGFPGEITEEDKDLIAFMIDKYIELILYENDRTVLGRVYNMQNIILRDQAYQVIEHNNLKDYIQYRLDYKSNDETYESIVEDAINAYYSNEIDSILSKTYTDLKEMLDSYFIAKDKYLNNDNQ